MDRFQQHSGRVFRLQFDEFQIVSSSHDDTILIWDFLNTGVDANNMVVDDGQANLNNNMVQQQNVPGADHGGLPAAIPMNDDNHIEMDGGENNFEMVDAADAQGIDVFRNIHFE